jgi:hypothetical protein
MQEDICNHEFESIEGEGYEVAGEGLKNRQGKGCVVVAATQRSSSEAR